MRVPDKPASPMMDGINMCHVAWMLMYGEEEHGRGDRQPGMNFLQDRTFQLGPDSDFELRPFQGGVSAYFHKPTDIPIATEFWIPAILPDAFVLTTINADERHKTAGNHHSEIAAYALRFDRLEEGLVPLLEEAGVTVFEEEAARALVVQLLRPRLPSNNPTQWQSGTLP